MAEHTAIEWCDRTWSPWEGCTKISPACDHCYAAARNGRFSKGANWGPGAPRRHTVDWDKPRRWNAEAMKTGRRLRVFPSICDPFDNEVDPAWRADFFELIHETPNLDWLLLSKRIGNARTMVPREWLMRDVGRSKPNRWPDNVWLGATVVTQEEADRDVPKLLAAPARVRFLSIEPMLGPIDLTYIKRGNGWTIDALRGIYSRHHDEGFDHPAAIEEHGGGPRIDWIVAGGESGQHARPAHPEWARSLRDQCTAAGVQFLWKQWGEWKPVAQMPISERRAARGGGDILRDDTFVRLDGSTHTTLRYDHEPHDVSDALVLRVGKKAAGRLLDGVTHDGFPA